MDGSPTGGGKCPVIHGTRYPSGTIANQEWWPNQLNLKVLHQNTPEANPYGAKFDYAKAFQGLDLDGVVEDLHALMTDSQEWWPADYGHYGPFFIRMAWHSAGTYRTFDGRGGARSGTQRFAPLNSWPDNGNLDKARRLLWPIKAKYGAALSWADLMILAGNVALESMGFKTWGFSGGREDVWEPEEDIYWGPEKGWLDDERYSGDRELANPLAAVQMGLIYVNPEGPNANPDPMGSARDIRETFARMAMNDEETVALVAGGHTFGKAHGAGDAGLVGPEPEGAPLVEMGLGWTSAHQSGRGIDAITSGIEGAWTPTPTTWDMSYFDVLFGYEWELTKSPAGANQWQAKGLKEGDHAPAADGNGNAPIMMTTADMALRTDPAYIEISKRFHKDPEAFAEAFAKAWYKLTHRDMGPHELGLGKLKAAEPMIWQDPVPAVDHALVDDADVAALKAQILDAGLPVSALVKAAWASASTYRQSDRRGGANGARVRLAPQKDWAVNDPAELSKVLTVLEGIKDGFDTDAKKVSMADLIVLAGCAGVEAAAKEGGHDVTVPFQPGRTDATDEMTDAESFDPLEPTSDAFRNYLSEGELRPQAELMIDRAQLMGLTAPEMTVLVGGLRAMGATSGNSELGVLTERPGALTRDVFKTVLDMDNTWKEVGDDRYESSSRSGAGRTWNATTVDLVFGSNSQLRALAEVYGSDDADTLFVEDFVAAWTKVMNADRFDI
ncbi:catalase/peroxidase HPI [Pseudaestuariivita sp.]|uniref:catalase/peroxidase HPI n=1 Tax=Pseudaestuariivita sp. TaxID=2211669 RepID=UPI0040599B3F